MEEDIDRFRDLIFVKFLTFLLYICNNHKFRKPLESPDATSDWGDMRSVELLVMEFLTSDQFLEIWKKNSRSKNNHTHRHLSEKISRPALKSGIYTESNVGMPSCNAGSLCSSLDQDGFLVSLLRFSSLGRFGIETLNGFGWNFQISAIKWNSPPHYFS